MEVSRLITVTTIMLAAGKAQFTVQPVSVERAEGLEAVFRCQYQVEGLTLAYDWSINSVIVSTKTESIRDSRPLSPGEPATLTIVATAHHNNSIVQCVARILDGIDILRSETSATVTLTVHATVITDIRNSSKTITVIWMALSLTEYCVDINKTTLVSTEIVVHHSVCRLANEYIFMYSNHSVCERFSFTVTPTQGEMRGTTSEPVTGFFTGVEGSGEQHRIRENGENKSVEFEATVPSCTSFIWYRVDSDLLTPSIGLSITDPLFNGSLSFSLPTDMMTEYSVTLTDENGIDLVFRNISISTFDVQDLLVSECPGGGCIDVTIVYVTDTLSPGALVCVIRISNGELDFTSMKVVIIPRTMSDKFTITLPCGDYRVIIYDVEINFKLRIPVSMAADIEDVTVATSGEMTYPSPNSEDISATKLPNGYLQVNCSDSALNCLVMLQSTSILDRVIVGVINASLSSTAVSLFIDTFGDGYVIVYSWNTTQSIFEGKVSLIAQLAMLSPTSPTTSSTTTPGTELLFSLPAVAIAVAAVGAVIAVTLILKRRRTQFIVEVPPRSDGRVDWSSTYAGIEQPNEAYAPVLSKNIAYEHLKPQKQTTHVSQPPRATEGEYDIIEPPHEYESIIEPPPEYEEVLPKTVSS